jgi:hypothetical protein
MMNWSYSPEDFIIIDAVDAICEVLDGFVVGITHCRLSLL